jgi:hypothetical protein
MQVVSNNTKARKIHVNGKWSDRSEHAQYQNNQAIAFGWLCGHEGAKIQNRITLMQII